jgi:hypothetical protein
VLSFWVGFVAAIGVVGSIVTMALLAAETGRGRVRRKWTRTELVIVGATAIFAIGLGLARGVVAFSRSPPTTPRAENTTSGATSSTTTIAPPPTTMATIDAAYCQLSREVLAAAARFQGGAAMGNSTRADVQPIIDNLTATLKVAPEAVRDDLRTLLAMFSEYQRRLTSDRFANLGLALATIGSPSAAGAAERIDSFDNLRCPSA